MIDNFQSLNQVILLEIPIILMSNYTHPMQDEYDKKVSKILHACGNSNIQLNAFIRVLGENQIKFFSKDDVSKFSKLCNPFDKLNPNTAFIHLELICVHVALQIKYFIVKFTGKSFKALNLKPIELKKVGDSHAMEMCIIDFKNKMIKLHGRENFWFRALGGIAGTNQIKRQLFQKKISRIFVNTCHSNCVNRFLAYISDSNPESDILWQSFRKKINLKISPMFEVNIHSPPKQTLSPSRSAGKLKNLNQNYLRITTFQLNDQKTNQLATLDHVKGESQNLSILAEKPRRRLKTLHDRPKIISNQSCNLQHSLGPLVQEIIYAKNNRYKAHSPRKKCKTSLENY